VRIVSAFVAAPIAALVFGGVTGSGTDLLVAAFQQGGSDLQTAVLQQSLISDPIDKTVTYLIVFTILGLALAADDRALPAGLSAPSARSRADDQRRRGRRCPAGAAGAARSDRLSPPETR
jgi:hypothetical protein